MTKTAVIMCHYHAVPHGKGYKTYAWDGPRGARVFVGDINMIDGELPWPLKLLERDEAYRGGWYVRTDTHTWWITCVLHRIGNAWAWVNVRLLATLQVWGLLEYQSYIMPRWRDLKIFRARARRRYLKRGQR